MRRVLVSACLLGRPVRYDGRAKPVEHDILARWRAEGRLVPVCPEIAGGLPVPRPPAEIEPGADAAAVLAGTARIRTAAGEDVTAPFVAGAHDALAAARRHNAAIAVLKDGSPSCAATRVYDGTFTGTQTAGTGATTALLRAHGIAVYPETALEAADAHLRRLETTP
ncbi:DUF523 domain-containing protein [Allonocardiopsis opalescens]|uniref:Uncharacterized protein YbbK (DUF523 family) n=1 Tax=Allonocardiopsis opalescens TaxID=1144618 RepID=A0A2T0Q4E0_9ACTN|nr:2-thiouracil desulfurase family protein [Allonocardiopsis opalescens]PRX98662.1 uncharacterized protein YbbK (DUF523 family) [Allonocardiopsis opalescens]